MSYFISQKSLLTIETIFLINYNIKVITNENQKLWQTSFDFFSDLRSKICITESVHNYKKNGAPVKVQIFPVSPACYTPKLGFSRHFSGQQWMCIIHGRLR